MPGRSFRPSEWGQSGWSILFTLVWLQKILGIRKDRLSFECMKGMCLFTSHFCLFFDQYDDLFMTDPVQSLHQMGPRRCTIYRGSFCDDCQNWFLIFLILFTLLEWSIRFIQGNRVKRMVFSFFMLIKMTLFNVQVF